MMDDAIGTYRKSRYPKHRELLGNLASLTPKHPIQVLIEVDVKLEVEEPQGTPLFLNPFLPLGVPVKAKLNIGKNELRNEALSDLSLLRAPERSFHNQIAFLKDLKVKTLVFPTYFAEYLSLNEQDERFQKNR